MNIHKKQLKLKNKDKSSSTALRLLHGAVKQLEIDNKSNNISSQEFLSLVAKHIKQRKDARAQFQNTGHYDLVDKEKQELATLSK